MTDLTPANDALRELSKIETTLEAAELHLTKRDESNAAGHMSQRVLYSPLTVAVVSARESAKKIRTHLELTTEARAENDELRKDANWLLDEFGLDHWRGCDVGDEDCYQCEGYLTTRDRINPEGA